MNDITPAEAMATIRRVADLFAPPACPRCLDFGELVALGNGRYIRLDEWNGDEGDFVDCPECKGEQAMTTTQEQQIARMIYDAFGGPYSWADSPFMQGRCEQTATQIIELLKPVGVDREELTQLILWVRSAERNLGQAMKESNAGIRAICLKQLDNAVHDLDSKLSLIAAIAAPVVAPKVDLRKIQDKARKELNDGWFPDPVVAPEPDPQVGEVDSDNDDDSPYLRFIPPWVGENIEKLNCLVSELRSDVGELYRKNEALAKAVAEREEMK